MINTGVFRLIVITASLVVFSYVAQAKSTKAIEQTFQQAMNLVEQNELNQAKALLSQLLTETPQLLRVRAEFAKVEYLLGNYQSAIDELSLLLNNTSLPINVHRNLNILKHKAQEKLAHLKQLSFHRFYGRVSVGAGYDSLFLANSVESWFDADYATYSDDNAAFGLDYAFMSLEPDLALNTIGIDTQIAEDFCPNGFDIEQPCQAFVDALKESGVTPVDFYLGGFVDESGQYVTFIEVELLDDNKLQQLSNKSGGFWQQRVSLTHHYKQPRDQLIWQNNISYSSFSPFSVNEFKKNNIKFKSHLMWKPAEHWLVSGKLHVDSVDLNEFSQIRQFGIQPQLSYVNDYGKFSTTLGISKKNYRNDSVNTFSAKNRSFMLSWSQFFFDKSLFVRAYSKYSHNSFSHENGDYHANSQGLTLLYKVSDKFNVLSALDRIKVHYDYKDDMLRLDWRLSFNYNFTDKWQGNLSWKHSNISDDFFEHQLRENMYFLGITRKF